VDCPKIVKAFSKLLVNEYNNGPTGYTDHGFINKQFVYLITQGVQHGCSDQYKYGFFTSPESTFKNNSFFE
jgi:hypothetical protein